MKTRILILLLTLAGITNNLGDSITYNFQSIAAGPLPGGFLSLTTSGVNAFFSGDGTTVGVNPVTGTHVLYAGNFQNEMGIEFSSPVTQIILGLDGNFPTANNSVQAFSYYGPGYGLYPMTEIVSSGSMLVFNVPNNFPEVSGILLDSNGGNGYSLGCVSIQVIPEPVARTILASGIALASALGNSRRSSVKQEAKATA